MAENLTMYLFEIVAFVNATLSYRSSQEKTARLVARQQKIKCLREFNFYCLEKNNFRESDFRTSDIQIFFLPNKPPEKNILPR